jgi:CheY-like chemotaxis protein
MARILFIDDNPTIRTLAGRVLTASGHHATLAANGRVGIEAYHRDLYELVVTDIFMPEQDGIETIGQIRRTMRGTPILVISGSHRGSEYLRAASALGASGTLGKPFTPDQLIDAVDRLLGLVA